MEKLDAMFDGEASNYVKHTVQNWTNEPFIRGAPSNLWYTKLMANEFRDSPLNEQVSFAREFVAGKYAPTVHGICLTGRRAALNAIRKEYKYCYSCHGRGFFRMDHKIKTNNVWLRPLVIFRNPALGQGSSSPIINFSCVPE
jgi:hypothetical protein